MSFNVKNSGQFPLGQVCQTLPTIKFAFCAFILQEQGFCVCWNHLEAVKKLLGLI